MVNQLPRAPRLSFVPRAPCVGRNTPYRGLLLTRILIRKARGGFLLAAAGLADCVPCPCGSRPSGFDPCRLRSCMTCAPRSRVGGGGRGLRAGSGVHPFSPSRAARACTLAACSPSRPFTAPLPRVGGREVRWIKG